MCVYITLTFIDVFVSRFLYTVYSCIDIYKEREKEKDRERESYIYIYIYVHIHHSHNTQNPSTGGGDDSNR